jgi:predicted nucleotidyltransferase
MHLRQSHSSHLFRGDVVNIGNMPSQNISRSAAYSLEVSVRSGSIRTEAVPVLTSDSMEFDPLISPVLNELDRLAGIDVAWVFGSRASDIYRSDSDLDLGVLFKRRPGAEELLLLRGELEATGGLAVDVVDLDGASPILARQVLVHGRLLIDHNPRRRAQFEARVPGRYEDVMLVRRDAERILLERVRDART